MLRTWPAKDDSDDDNVDDDDDDDDDNDDDDNNSDDDNEDVEVFEVFEDNRDNNITTRECPICFEEIPEDSIRFLPCMHSFHDACITTWADINDTCPVCKNNNTATQRE